MKEQKKNEKGITLVALIITIIVMLILAAVSVRTIVGDNGIIGGAEDAKSDTEWAEIIEEIDYMLLEYNFGSEDITISAFLNNKVAEGEIDKFFAYPNEDDTYSIIIQIDGYYYSVDEVKGVYEATLLGDELDGYTVYTKEDFSEETGTLTFDLGEDESTTVLFMDDITATLNFEIKSGEVTIYITQDMYLSNQNMERSAIDIYDGATLNLHIGNDITMTVDSSFGGTAGGGTSADDIYGGSGAYAGIHVPEGAEFNLYGSGTLIAYGGDAGDGGTCTTNAYDYGGAGGGGAGAGIGGNGGNGADGVFKYGADGEAGEDAGEINIYDTIEVYAYGGGRRIRWTRNPNSNKRPEEVAGGGYPAAGIGRRRSRRSEQEIQHIVVEDFLLVLWKLQMDMVQMEKMHILVMQRIEIMFIQEAHILQQENKEMEIYYIQILVV